MHTHIKGCCVVKRSHKHMHVCLSELHQARMCVCVMLPEKDVIFILHKAVLQAIDPTQTSTDNCPVAAR